MIFACGVLCGLFLALAYLLGLAHKSFRKAEDERMQRISRRARALLLILAMILAYFGLVVFNG